MAWCDGAYVSQDCDAVGLPDAHTDSFVIETLRLHPAECVAG
jgi:hypothetical protein